MKMMGATMLGLLIYYRRTMYSQYSQTHSIKNILLISALTILASGCAVQRIFQGPCHEMKEHFENAAAAARDIVLLRSDATEITGQDDKRYRIHTYGMILRVYRGTMMCSGPAEYVRGVTKETPYQVVKPELLFLNHEKNDPSKPLESLTKDHYYLEGQVEVCWNEYLNERARAAQKELLCDSCSADSCQSGVTSINSDQNVPPAGEPSSLVVRDLLEPLKK